MSDTTPDMPAKVPDEPTRAPRRVLIYRLGSVGDTIVALPALRMVQRAFPEAKRWLLTTRPEARGVAMTTLLHGTGLIEHSIDYRRGERQIASLLALRQEIRAFRPDILVYLTEPRGALSVWRDILFFRLCGIGCIVGAPLTSRLRTPRFDPATGWWESEGARLARTIASLGPSRLDEPASWRLDPSPEVRIEAATVLGAWRGAGHFIAACVNSKEAAKDWGEANWAAWLERLGAASPGLGLLLVGGPADEARSQRLAARWQGPVSVQCNRPIRVTQALMAEARIYVGTDGGPMHLAAAAGVPCVALFSNLAPPGVWYPAGPDHTILRPPDSTNGTATIPVDAVLAACAARLGLSRSRFPA